MDNEGNIGCFVPAEDGIYLFDRTSIDLVPGKQYHISIELLSGEVYESIPQVMSENYAISESRGELVKRTRVSQQNVDVVENVVRVNTDVTCCFSMILNFATEPTIRISFIAILGVDLGALSKVITVISY